MSRETTKRREREELAAFLRARRSKLSPEAAGLPRGTRRRVPGLRREEVAHLSGVSVTWYTWLEQAKDIRVSAHFLERLAEGLKLNSAEKKHLFDLCQIPLQERVSSSQIEVSEGLSRMLETVAGPAYLLTTRRWDTIYWNVPCRALFAPPGFPINTKKATDYAFNIMELIFIDEYHRSMMVDWESWAKVVVAKFRLDVTPVLNEPDVVELIEKLKSGSPEFRRWWREPDVVGREEYPRTYVHPMVGKLIFTPATFTVEHIPGLRMRVFTAKDATTAEKLRYLVDRLSPPPFERGYLVAANG